VRDSAEIVLPESSVSSYSEVELEIPVLASTNGADIKQIKPLNKICFSAHFGISLLN
jgi:hypothetical protein